ncbi:MAG: NAD(P)/FAD-dependent oxidoreductase [Gammaproteobacteria bacterium]
MSRLTVVGAGLAGTLAALFMARRGLPVSLYERRPDPRRVAQPAGRSINLALANRGLKPLEAAGLAGQVRPLLTVMRGRMVHDREGGQDLQPYGQQPHEIIYSVSRPGLNALLLDAAEAEGVDLQFGMRLVEAHFEANRLVFRDESDGSLMPVPMAPTVAADGAGSPVRMAMAERPGFEAHSDMLAHGYKELTMPPAEGGGYAMEPHALHIWPRGGYMLIALPNADGSFTVTLFMPYEGTPSFADLRDRDAVRDFFESAFPDAAALMPGYEAQFEANPLGELGTVRCRPWHVGGRAVLIGDAAHAIVPFHGQGMNCAFEDCLALDECVEAHGEDWARVFEDFFRQRKPNAEAIADMALENYVEMRDSVRDPRFRLRKEVAFALERRFPERFVTRYGLVMFRDDVSYAEAQRRGRVQAQILDELVADVEAPEQVDFDRARRLVQARLSPLAGAKP